MCRKIGKGHKTLLPGTVTMHCQHGMFKKSCYVMSNCIKRFPLHYITLRYITLHYSYSKLILFFLIFIKTGIDLPIDLPI